MISILTTVVSVLRLPPEVDEYADRSVAISYGLVGSALQFLHLSEDPFGGPEHA